MDINPYVVQLLKSHYSFSTSFLEENKNLISKVHFLMKDDFYKLLIDVKNLSDYKNVEMKNHYFLGALKNKLQEYEEKKLD